MLNKLLKYDLKSMYKFIFVFYLLAIGGALITRILFEIKQTAIVIICGQVMLGFMYAMVANILINTVIRLWVTFKNHIYGDEGYLLNTLPVSKKNILLSKILSSLIILCTSFIAIIISLLITYYSKDFYNTCMELLNNISNLFNMSSFAIVITFLTIFFLEIVAGIIVGYLGIILGHRKNNNKILHSITASVIIYSISQIVVLLMIFIYGFFNNDFMQLFVSGNMDLLVIKPLLYVDIIIYVINILVLYLLSNYYFNKGINID